MSSSPLPLVFPLFLFSDAMFTFLNDVSILCSFLDRYLGGVGGLWMCEQHVLYCLCHIWITAQSSIVCLPTGPLWYTYLLQLKVFLVILGNDSFLNHVLYSALRVHFSCTLFLQLSCFFVCFIFSLLLCSVS